ncbi:MAG: hypothetical protein QGH33_04065, partial [Pirellulaceae bacterium]|nr:hypothetical protein [Pirellulaceae bacterium]
CLFDMLWDEIEQMNVMPQACHPECIRATGSPDIEHGAGSRRQMSSNEFFRPCLFELPKAVV